MPSPLSTINCKSLVAPRNFFASSSSTTNMAFSSMLYTGFPDASRTLVSLLIRAYFSIGVACNAISIRPESTRTVAHQQIEKTLINQYFCLHPFINEEKKVSAIFRDSRGLHTHVLRPCASRFARCSWVYLYEVRGRWAWDCRLCRPQRTLRQSPLCPFAFFAPEAYSGGSQGDFS